MRIVPDRADHTLSRHFFALLVLTSGLLFLDIPSQAQDANERGADPVPAVVVQIRFDVGGRSLWMDAFEAHLVPAIQAAIDAGELRGFAYYEAIVPGQSYDFILILEADSFAFFDSRRPYPHYAALLQREGVEEGRRILSQMTGWEADVSVHLVRGFADSR